MQMATEIVATSRRFERGSARNQIKVGVAEGEGRRKEGRWPWTPFKACAVCRDTRVPSRHGRVCGLGANAHLLLSNSEFDLTQLELIATSVCDSGRLISDLVTVTERYTRLVSKSSIAANGRTENIPTSL